MKKTFLLLMLFSSLLLCGEEYTIVFNSGNSDSSSPATKLEQIIYTSSDDCVNKLLYANKVYRAKDGFGIKLSNSTNGGKLSLGLNTQYNISSMTIYAAALAGKDTANAIVVCGQRISWKKGKATILTPYTVAFSGLTDSIVIAASVNKNNRFYVQKIVFTAPDPLPGVAKITVQPEVDFGGAIVIDGQPATDAQNINILARATSNDSLALKLHTGTTFALAPTRLSHLGGDVNISYVVTQATDKGFPVTDSLIISAKGTNGNIVRKAIAISLYAKNYTSPIFEGDSACMRIGKMPGNYYQPAQGLCDSALKEALSEVIHCGPRYRYGAGHHHTWHGFFYTDRDTVTQQVLDMYSNNVRFFDVEDTCGSVSEFDIEHMLPKSWWGGDVNEAYCDLFHLVPADYSANRSKSNNAPGIPTDSTFNNGSFVTGSGKTYGLTRVFCPADMYKGDFARAYFYIVTCYDSLQWVTTGDAGKAMTNDSYLEFRPWLQELLMSWHRKDPVSDKEKARAIEVNKIQGNRNPFIDYPELAEYIWGNKQGQNVDFYQLEQSFGDPYSETPTSITTQQSITKGSPRKVHVDDAVYIVVDGNVYTILGTSK